MKTAACLLAAVLVTASFAASAQEPGTIDNSPSPTAMAVDLLLVRPISLVATIVGVGLFVLDLPLSIIQGEPPAEPARKLVVEPARFTFVRKLGSMDYASMQ